MKFVVFHQIRGKYNAIVLKFCTFFSFEMFSVDPCEPVTRLPSVRPSLLYSSMTSATVAAPPTRQLRSSSQPRFSRRNTVADVAVHGQKGGDSYFKMNFINMEIHRNG